MRETWKQQYLGAPLLNWVDRSLTDIERIRIEVQQLSAESGMEPAKNTSFQLYVDDYGAVYVDMRTTVPGLPFHRAQPAEQHYSFTVHVSEEGVYIIDSGSTANMFQSSKLMTDYKESVSRDSYIKCAGNQRLVILGVGNVGPLKDVLK